MSAEAGPLEPTAPAAAVVVASADEAEAGVRYVGLATRAISFAIDAAIIDLVAIVVGIGASLILSLLYLPGDIKTVLAVIGGVALIAWCVGYFVVFWSTTGQTPGARVMEIRVVTDDGTRLKPSRALVRCVGVLLAALPLFAGFIRILFDARRRGFQDRLAGTLVIEAPQTSYIAARRATANPGERERARRRAPSASG
ncbi:MAG: RDD family protein [Solirubrobacterales bacterium]|nr:RDD family protein [Solirubrobacterales bacterium]